jgi:TetR/AcrR family transcriptional regulator, transcriptional repressor for nem operon
MSSGRPRRTREEVLTASIRLMQRKGFGALGMREIAKELDIKAPSLYHHFPSKEQLAQRALEQYRLEQHERLQVLSTAKTVAERMLGYAELFSRMLKDDGRLCLFLVLSQERAAVSGACIKELRRFAEQNVAWLEKTLQPTASRARPRSALSPRDMANVLFGAFEGFMITSFCENKSERVFLEKAENLLTALGLLATEGSSH